MQVEQVLVVKTDKLNLPRASYLQDPEQISTLLHICSDNYQFMPRPQAEEDPAFKQLIPYVTVIHQGTVLALERRRAQSESRLHGKISLGVGGHINPIDQHEDFSKLITQAMARELQEELWLKLDKQPCFAGIINDDSNSVGSVHLGLHYILRITSQPTVRETDKMQANWLSLPQLEALRTRMETWSQILLPALHSADHL